MEYTCIRCNKKFNAKVKSLVCPDCKIQTCVICGKKFELKYPYAAVTCSRKCSGIYRKQTGISKQVAEKAKKTLENKYGVANPRELQKNLVKKCKWCGKEFITDNPRQEYCGDDYGNCPVCGKRVKIKDYSIGAQACFDICRIKLIENTNLQKYGDKTAVNSKYAREKAKKTCLEKYGVEHYSKTNLFTKQMMKNSENSEKYLQFKSDPKSYIGTNYHTKPAILQIANDLGVTEMAVYQQLIKSDCRDIAVFKQSTIEHEVEEYIKNIYGGKVELHNRQIIKPLEIDIYIPELKIGFECNPTYTHNSTKGTIWNDRPVSNNYHREKSIKADKAGIFIFHIFGYEWTHKQDIIKSMIANLLNCNTDKYYARNLTVKEVSYTDSVKFLNENHRQGWCISSIRLGLYNDNELISLMTFGKNRPTATNNEIAENEYELLRFCNKKYTTVAGGASKLFSHFTKLYNPQKVISYSDIARARGALYEKLGFTFEHINSPGYVWVNEKSDEYYNRVTCQKKNLQKLFSDASIDIEHKTEKEIMQEHGFVKVFDSGTVKWEWKKNNLL